MSVRCSRGGVRSRQPSYARPAPAGVPPAIVIGAVFVGKFLWFCTMLTLLARAPGVLVRLPVAGARVRAAFERAGWSMSPAERS